MILNNYIVISSKRGVKMKKRLNLIGYRKMADYTQSELAKKINISYSNYNSKENGKTEFTYSECLKIRDILMQRLGKTLTIDELFA